MKRRVCSLVSLCGMLLVSISLADESAINVRTDKSVVQPTVETQTDQIQRDTGDHESASGLLRVVHQPQPLSPSDIVRPPAVEEPQQAPAVQKPVQKPTQKGGHGCSSGTCGKRLLSRCRLRGRR